VGRTPAVGDLPRQAAMKFQSMVNANGQRWPEGWVKGVGFASLSDDPGEEHPLLEFGTAYIRRLTSAGPDTQTRSRRMRSRTWRSNGRSAARRSWCRPEELCRGRGGARRRRVGVSTSSRPPSLRPTCGRASGGRDEVDNGLGERQGGSPEGSVRRLVVLRAAAAPSARKRFRNSGGHRTQEDAPDHAVIDAG